MFFHVTSQKKLTTVLTVSLFAVVLLCAVVFRVFGDSSEKNSVKNAVDPKMRVEYLQALGYTVDLSVPEQSENMEIPYVFNEVFEQYNLMQKRAGMDLSNYGGRQTTQFTYKLSDPTRTDVYAHLIVLEDRVIGGDITAASVSDGYTKPLLLKE